MTRIGICAALLSISIAASAPGAQVPFGNQQVISTAGEGARSVFAADVDGDGDLDVLSASQEDDEIAWYENRGGQFALASADTAPLLLLQAGSSDLLEIVMTHRGRAGDGGAELATLELLFEEDPAIRSRAPRQAP